MARAKRLLPATVLLFVMGTLYTPLVLADDKAAADVRVSRLQHQARPWVGLAAIA